MRAAAAELGYRPNVAARALRTGVARSVAPRRPGHHATRSSGASCAAPSAPRSRPATPSCWSTSATTAPGRPRRWRRCSPAPSDGLLLFEADAPARARREHGDPDRDAARASCRSCASTSRRASTPRSTTCSELGHARIGHLASSFAAPTFDLRARRDRRAAARRTRPPARRVARSRSRAPPRRPGALLDEDGVTAVFCDDDILAGGVYLAARDARPADPRGPLRRRLRRPRLRAGPRAAADDDRASTPRASARPRSRRWRGTWPGEPPPPSRSCRSGSSCASRPRRRAPSRRANCVANRT